MWTVGSTVRIMFASLARWMFETNWLMFSEERWPEGELFHHCWGVEHGIEWHMPSSCEMFFAIYNPGVRISFKPSRVARYKRWQYWVALVCPLHFVFLINICNSVWEGGIANYTTRKTLFCKLRVKSQPATTNITRLISPRILVGGLLVKHLSFRRGFDNTICPLFVTFRVTLFLYFSTECWTNTFNIRSRPILGFLANENSRNLSRSAGVT